MISNKITTGTDSKMSSSAFRKDDKANDAAAWANLLEQYLGPDQDVYRRLLEKPELPGETKN